MVCGSFTEEYQTCTDHLSNECKRRKLKCSGGPVCERCSRDKVTCVYATNRSPGVSQETEVNVDQCVHIRVVHRPIKKNIC
jgi:hypothetical protein